MKLRIIIFFVAAIVGSAAYMFFNRSNPVLYRHENRASVQYDAFVLLNPFRDREPERHAELVFQGLKTGNCRQALSLTDFDSVRLAHYCKREEEYPIASYSLMDYRWGQKKLILIYELYRNYDDRKNLSPPVWIDVENINGKWRVTGYDTYY